MQMTDHEILQSYTQAKDRKEQIRILADLNCVGIWEMWEYLVSLGAQLDGRWFQNLNPKREGMAEKGGRNKGAAADPDARLRGLKKQLAEMGDEVAAQREQVVELNALIRELRSDIEQGKRELVEKDAELTRQREETAIAENKYLSTITDLEAKVAALESVEFSSALDPGTVIDYFVSDLTGTKAYLCGRLLEELYAWRFNDNSHKIHILRLFDQLLYGGGGTE